MAQFPIPRWCRPGREPWRWQELFDDASEPILELFRQSQFQDASSARFLKLSMAIANELLDDQGFIHLERLSQIRSQIMHWACPLRSQVSGEYWRIKHVLKVLDWLEDPEIRQFFERTSKGVGVLGVDRILLLSLRNWPGCENLSAQQLTNRHVRLSLLSAWFTYLRQTVGSCFATAPAILVLTQQPHMFLQDMQQLLQRGILKRTFDGKEFTVPAAEDPGLADLRKRQIFKPSLLKSPGILWSLESAGVLALTGNLIEDIDRFSNQLLPIAKELSADDGWLSPLRLIEAWICRHFSISLENFREYQERPSQQIPSGSLQVGVGSRSTVLDAALLAFQRAKEAFCLWTDHPLLRMWEFTLASFSDTRQDYCQWSLHTSLGMNYDQNGGLAQRLYQILQDKVAEYNEKSHSLQPDCDNMNYQVQHVLTRLQSAKNEQELTWLRAEYQSLRAELEQLQHERDSYHHKAQAFANLFNDLLEQYSLLFEQYFQQVYDPQLRGAEVGPYDDSPAGFRLVFKAGRSQASSWTPISNSAQFTDAIARFLIVTEHEMLQSEKVQIIQDDFSHIVTLLVQHVRSQEFIKSAFARMAQGLSTPVDLSSEESMERSPITPWAYVSGGTMKALLSQYYGRIEPAQEKQSWFHDIRELWVFLIDIMRDMPQDQSQKFLEDPSRPLLMHSHSHAFLFLPGHPTFVPCWTSTMYPYTWIRDHYEQEMRDIYSGCLLDADAQKILLDCFIKENNIPKDWVYFPSIRQRFKPHDFRKECLHRLQRVRDLPTWQILNLVQSLDSILLRMLPILDAATVFRRIEEFCEQSELLLLLDRQNLIQEWLQKISEMGTHIPSCTILDCFYQAYRLGLKSNVGYGPTPTPLELRLELARFGLGLPMPVFFADTNWDHYHFAFVLNPGSDELELWKLEPDSLYGYSMYDWSDQFQESSINKLWGVYYCPQQYLG